MNFFAQSMRCLARGSWRAVQLLWAGGLIARLAVIAALVVLITAARSAGAPATEGLLSALLLFSGFIVIYGLITRG